MVKKLSDEAVEELMAGGVQIIQGAKGSGMGLFSAMMTHRMMRLLKKPVVVNYRLGNYQPFTEKDFMKQSGGKE